MYIYINIFIDLYIHRDELLRHISNIYVYVYYVYHNLGKMHHYILDVN